MTVLPVTAPCRPVLAEWLLPGAAKALLAAGLLPGAWRLAGKAADGKDPR